MICKVLDGFTPVIIFKKMQIKFLFSFTTPSLLDKSSRVLQLPTQLPI